MLMNLDFVIVISYLLLTLYVGFRQGVTVKSLREYSVAKLDYTTFAIVATMSATLIGGGTMGVADKVYQYGIVYVLVVGGAAINQIFIGQCIVPRIKNFKNFISIGDLMKSLYGRDVQVITGICAAMVSMGFVSTQISAIGELIRQFLGFEKIISVSIGYGLVIFYSAFGGMRSVVATDIIQFIILMVAIPIICTLGINKLGGFENFYTNISETSLHIDLFEHNHMNEFLIFLMVGAFIPSFLQRILIAQNIRQASKATTVNGIISFPFYVIIGLIGLIAFQLSPNMEEQKSVLYLVENIMPYGIKGLVIAGMLSVLMSSADSELNVAGVSIVNDVFKNAFKMNISSKGEVLVARAVTSLVGVGTIMVAMSFKNIIDIMLYAFTFWAPTILVPLTFALYGFKVNRFVFYLGLIVSLMSVFVFNEDIAALTGLDPIISSILVTVIFYITYFIITNCRNLKGSTSNYVLAMVRKIHDWQFETERFVNFLGKKFKDKIVYGEINKNNYEFFGVFCFLFYLIPYFLWSHSDKNYSIIIMFRIIACVMSILLIMQESWKKELRKWLPLYWSVALIFTLPFLSTYMLFHNHFELPWIMNSIIAMFILVLLVDWFSFVFILVTGVFVAIIVFDLTDDFRFDLVHAYNLLFGGIMYLFALVVGTISLFKREQAENIVTEKNVKLEKLNKNLEKIVEKRTSHLVGALNAKQEFLNNMSHEIRTPVHGIYNISAELSNNWKGLEDEKKQECIRILASSGERLANLVNNVLDLSKITSGIMQYSFSVCSLNSIINSAIDYAKSYADLNSLKFDVKYQEKEDVKIKCDSTHMKIVLQNILTNAIKYGGGKVFIEVITAPDIKIIISDNGIGIPKKEMKKIFEPFVESSLTKNRGGGKGIGLALCKEIMHAHAGEVVTKKPPEGKGAIFEITLPRKK